VPLPELFARGNADQVREQIERGWMNGAISLYGLWRGLTMFGATPISPLGRDAAAFRAQFFPETRVSPGKVALDHSGAELRIERWDGQIEVWTELATDAAGRDWLQERGIGASPSPTKPAPPSRLKPFWKQAEAMIIEWLEENGYPMPGDGKQAELERWIADQLEKRGLEASESAIRRHVRDCIKRYRARVEM
jgi:hypothetical protein